MATPWTTPRVATPFTTPRASQSSTPASSTAAIRQPVARHRLPSPQSGIVHRLVAAKLARRAREALDQAHSDEYEPEEEDDDLAELRQAEDDQREHKYEPEEEDDDLAELRQAVDVDALCIFAVELEKAYDDLNGEVQDLRVKTVPASGKRAKRNAKKASAKARALAARDEATKFLNEADNWLMLLRERVSEFNTDGEVRLEIAQAQLHVVAVRALVREAEDEKTVAASLQAADAAKVEQQAVRALARKLALQWGIVTASREQ